MRFTARRCCVFSVLICLCIRLMLKSLDAPTAQRFLTSASTGDVLYLKSGADVVAHGHVPFRNRCTFRRVKTTVLYRWGRMESLTQEATRQRLQAAFDDWAHSTNIWYSSSGGMLWPIFIFALVIRRVFTPRTLRRKDNVNAELRRGAKDRRTVAPDLPDRDRSGWRARDKRLKPNSLSLPSHVMIPLH